MADERLKIDANYWKVSGAVTDDSNLDIVMLRVDPVTKRLKVEQSSLVSSVDNVSIIDIYHISDIDDSSPAYYGFVDKDGNWYIMKEDTGTYRYCKGTTDYSTNWSNRASLTYDYYDNIF
ncbi:MAG TPA: hypothetical protein ENL06_01500 [Candidatus Portnoybacteria bacterium]|nr:hypothetical protein [Candidatus Portnoybacteria bacterium]